MYLTVTHLSTKLSTVAKEFTPTVATAKPSASVDSFFVNIGF